jgi:hypothetical protein
MRAQLVKLAAAVAVLSSVVTLSATGLAGAASAAIGPSAVAGQALAHPSHVYDGKKSGGPTVGSTWTYYDTSGSGVCEVLTFVSHNSFTGDKGDAGTWKGALSLKFVNGVFFNAASFKGKYNSYVSTNYFGQYTIVGVLTEKASGVPYAPEYVLAGNDPLGEGDC